jgi:hypothetical protein
LIPEPDRQKLGGKFPGLTKGHLAIFSAGKSRDAEAARMGTDDIKRGTADGSGGSQDGQIRFFVFCPLVHMWAP